mmetsp:Transcript_13476/g.24036  ORF Transcript_13476/g.24036 Transcript_13476/m.24036 type:complete len:514 (-) Transcript_13476:399-1940(-)
MLGEVQIHVFAHELELLHSDAAVVVLVHRPECIREAGESLQQHLAELRHDHVHVLQRELLGDSLQVVDRPLIGLVQDDDMAVDVQPGPDVEVCLIVVGGLSGEGGVPWDWLLHALPLQELAGGEARVPPGLGKDATRVIGGPEHKHHPPLRLGLDVAPEAQDVPGPLRHPLEVLLRGLQDQMLPAHKGILRGADAKVPRGLHLGHHLRRLGEVDGVELVLLVPLRVVPLGEGVAVGDEEVARVHKDCLPDAQICVCDVRLGLGAAWLLVGRRVVGLGQLAPLQEHPGRPPAVLARLLHNLDSLVCKEEEKLEFPQVPVGRVAVIPHGIKLQHFPIILVEALGQVHLLFGGAAQGASSLSLDEPLHLSVHFISFLGSSLRTFVAACCLHLCVLVLWIVLERLEGAAQLTVKVAGEGIAIHNVVNPRVDDNVIAHIQIIHTIKFLGAVNLGDPVPLHMSSLPHSTVVLFWLSDLNCIILQIIIDIATADATRLLCTFMNTFLVVGKEPQDLVLQG